MANIAPVSYTHLDVYKRQIMGTVRKFRERRFNLLYIMPIYSKKSLMPHHLSISKQ